MKTEQHEIVPQTEQQRIECAIDTALLNADLLREQVAELEAENAGLRKRVCVPDGWMVVPSQCTSQMEDAYDQQCADDNAYGCSMHLPAYEAMLTAAPAPVERVEQEAEDLDSRLRDAGMTGVADLLKGAPLDAFIKHAGVNDLGSLLQWAEMRRAECLRAMARYDLGEKPGGDDFYEWTVAHCAAFTELHVNLRAAIDTTQPAAPAPDVAGLVEALRSIYDEDYQAPHDATDFDVSESRKQCIYRIRRKVKDALATFHREG